MEVGALQSRDYRTNNGARRQYQHCNRIAVHDLKELSENTITLAVLLICISVVLKHLRKHIEYLDIYHSLHFSFCI